MPLDLVYFEYRKVRQQMHSTRAFEPSKTNDQHSPYSMERNLSVQICLDDLDAVMWHPGTDTTGSGSLTAMTS